MEKELNTFSDENILDTGKYALYRVPVVFAVSLFLSLSPLLGALSPFSAALISSSCGFDVFAAFAGAVLGLFVKGDFFEAVPLTGCMLVLAVFRFILGTRRGFLVKISSSALCGAGVATAFLVGAQKPTDIITAFSFGFISAIASLSLATVTEQLPQRRIGIIDSASGLGACALLFAFCIASLGSFNISVINLGVAVSTAAIIICATKYRSGGAVCAAAASFGLLIADAELMPCCIMLCVSGVACGLLGKFGKITQAVGFVFCTGICMALTGTSTSALGAFCGIMSGAVLSFAVPEKLFESVGTRRIKQKTAAPVFAHRLAAAGHSMADIREAIAQTAEVLDKNIVKDVSWVYNSACDKVCRNCRHNMLCWGEEFNETSRIMNSVIPILRKNNLLCVNDFPPVLRERCEKMTQFSAEMNLRYREYVSNLASVKKIAQMRELLSAQFETTEKMLISMADEIKKDSQCESEDAKRVVALLKEQGISHPEAVIFSTEGRITVEAYGKGRLYCSAEELCEQMIFRLRREFELPVITVHKDILRIAMAERTNFIAQTECVQIGKGKENNRCGDYFDSFADGKGNAFVIISDGMGSGGRAKVDSALACTLLSKMLKQGIDIESALRTVNISLLVKSSDESFATADVCKINLYSGQTVFYKAGGATTFIRCGRNVVRLQGKGIPLGIQAGTVFSVQEFRIGEGDMILMASDGAEINESWICRELEKFAPNESLEDLVETVAGSARLSCEKGREDDITVVGIRLKK